MKFANVNPKGLIAAEEVPFVIAVEAQPGVPETDLGLLPGMGHGDNNVGRYLLLLIHAGIYGAVIDLHALGLLDWLEPIADICTFEECNHMMGQGVREGSQSHSLRVVGRSCLSAEVKLGYMADLIALILLEVGAWCLRFTSSGSLQTHYSLMN